MRRRAAAIALAVAAACTDPQPCPEPLEECGGQCVDVQSDRRHCGSCDAACGSDRVCRGGACSPDPRIPCHLRMGGAFVTLGHCGQAVKIWVRNAGFIEDAQAGPDPDLVPSLAVVEGADCDAQWSWHVDDRAASFVAADPSAACDVCPRAIQADVQAYVLSPGTWCPAGATVLAVDPRP